MLLNPRYVGRFRDVASVLVRHGFADVLAVLDLQRFLPGRDHVATSPAEKLHQRAKGLRLAFEELGATYIKLGQILSTRPDLLPAAYLEELAQLQDRVPPFAFAAVRHAIEEEQQLPMDRVFTRFDEVPAASASLSQVHRADLAPGAAPGALSREVAVKVLRPGVEREVELDLEILAEVASFASRSALGRKLELESVVEQLSRTLTDELDLTREARNAQHFRAAGVDADVGADRVQHVDAVDLRQFPWAGYEGVGLGCQRADGAKVDDVARQLRRQRLFDVGADFHVLAAIGRAQIGDASDLRDKTNATGAVNAAVH